MRHKIIAILFLMIIITRIDRLYRGFGFGYRIQAHTDNGYVEYRLLCGGNASILAVNETYSVMRGYDRSKRYMTFADILNDRGHPLECEIESEQTKSTK